MAIKTQSDIRIENTSYTNKDFSQIYPELVDLAKKITNKWDPETTNESDPGLVLLKLLAFIGDKNNYNIDKNILEQFMPSVTQETSMRNLCDMMGYNIGYYRSATCQVSFSYIGGNEQLDKALSTEQGGLGRFTLKAFDTSFKTDDNIVYTLIEDMEIINDTRTSTRTAIQGQIKGINLSSDSVTSNAASKIQLYNLDENNRIYIPDIMVAENGIFINREVYNETLNQTAWRRVDNLNDQEMGSKVFKFGFDSSRNLPYIEFPSDIAELIGDGLEIYYVVSDGVNGYAKANSLTSFNSYSFNVNGVTSLESSQYYLSNSTSTQGEQPETIDEAYRNFRKTVGTFDTLVSCRDYSNHIFTYEEPNTGNHIVSNVQATDIRTDPNRSINTLIRDKVGMTYYTTSPKDDSSYSDLILHGTKPFNYEITNKGGYDGTYTLLDDTDIVNINAAISDVKTLSHKLTRPKDSDIALIEERYTLNVNISTKYKVNETEQSSILKNVVNALYANFNARELDFGEEIPYDELVRVIEGADERIKLAVVDDPKITPYIVSGSGKSTAFDPSKESKDSGDGTKVVLENILGGRIQLYIQDNSFNLDYDMNLSTLALTKNIAAIKATTTISLPGSDEPYELRKNETIQLVEDSYISSKTYPTGVYYGMQGDRFDTVDGVPYQLKDNENLWIYYTDSNDVRQIVHYKAGDIIRTNGFDLTGTSNTAISTGSITTTVRWLVKGSAGTSYNEVVDIEPAEGTDSVPLYSIGTNETIELLKLNETILSDAQQNCFWYCRPIIHKGADGQYSILNQVEDDLIFQQDPSDATGNTYYHILEEDEVFIYPSSDGYSLFTLGSGTKLQVVFTDSDQHGDFIDVSKTFGKPEHTVYKLARQNTADGNVINIEELESSVASQDVNNFLGSYRWNVIDFSKVNLHIVESSISSYVEGDKLFAADGGIKLSDGEWKDASGLTTIEIENGVNKGLSALTNPKIRATLTFNGNAINPQKIEANQNITLLYYEELDKDGYYDSKGPSAAVTDLKSKSITTSDTSIPYIQLNISIDDYNDIVLRVMHYEEDEYGLRFNGRYEVPFSAIVYNPYSNSAPAEDGDDGYKLYNLIHGSSLIKSASRGEYIFTWDQIKSILTGNKLSITVPSDLDIYINLFDTSTAKTVLNPTVSEDGARVITLDLTAIANAHDETTRVYITVPKVLHINPILQSELDKGGNNVMQRILDTISTKYTNFDYLAPLSNSKIISSYDPVNSFFDYNNVYNPLTIGKIDFKECNFNIVASSRK